jgi:triosephosphate isomerase
MHKTMAEARAFAAELGRSPQAVSGAVRPFVVPAFPSIATVAGVLTGTRVLVGAQNMHWEDEGAWTGEVSPLMVKDCGAELVELGHSERRAFFNETDETVALKVEAALRHGLIALICVGDTKAEYEAGATAEVVARQTRRALARVGRQAQGRALIAYEPVWSIGDGGVPASPEFADEQHRRLKAVAAEVAGAELPIIYGGSVNQQNCRELALQPHIDGLFVGRAAWDARDFIDILNRVARALKA